MLIELLVSIFDGGGRLSLFEISPMMRANAIFPCFNLFQVGTFPVMLSILDHSSPLSTRIFSLLPFVMLPTAARTARRFPYVSCISLLWCHQNHHKTPLILVSRCKSESTTSILFLPYPFLFTLSCARQEHLLM